MKKYLSFIFTLIILVALFGPVAPIQAVVPCTAPGTPSGCTDYYLLAPVPCAQGTPGCVQDTNGKWVLKTFNPAQPNNLGAYLNIMIKIIIGLAAVLSVVMIVVGGIEYMTSELAHTKEAGKERILHAILGLLIALGAYALLYTINPDLLKSDLNIDQTTTTVTSGTQVTKGSCAITAKDGVIIRYPNVTNEGCISLFNPQESISMRWTPNP